MEENIYKMVVSHILPQNMLEWFEVTDVHSTVKDDEETLHISIRENAITTCDLIRQNTRCSKEEGRNMLTKWYEKVGKSENKVFNDIAAAMHDREDDILNYFVNRSTNASAESLNSKIKRFKAQLHGVVDIKFFLFRLMNIFA